MIPYQLLQVLPYYVELRSHEVEEFQEFTVFLLREGDCDFSCIPTLPQDFIGVGTDSLPSVWFLDAV